MSKKIYTRTINPDGARFCSSPWNTVSITNDNRPGRPRQGDVEMCLCRDWQTSEPIGNIFDKPLSEIFNDVIATKFRNTIVDQSFSYCDTNICGRYWEMKKVVSLDYEINKIKKTLPTNLALGLDSNCNLSCASCRSHSIFSPEIDETAWQILTKLSDEYKDFQEPTEISIDGTGDIFASATWRKYLNGNNVPKCFRFRITTNGNLITKNLDLIDNIKDQISEVTVSLDAGTSDTYKDIRGGNFKLVLEGIEALVSRGISVGTQFVLQQKNHKEIVIYRDLAKSLNVNWMGLAQIVHWGHMPAEYWNANKLEDNPNIDYDFLVESLREFSKTNNATMSGGLLKLIKE
jgi:MoaA/NifB/PqqE/SkfB family radical SAM enzyme